MGDPAHGLPGHVQGEEKELFGAPLMCACDCVRCHSSAGAGDYSQYPLFPPSACHWL